ncbi:MAG TPA: M20/M25/M40 family metallo-hydrolase [Steroidobacteraceae bacterium]|nr:M20/M25/M40 family metallo-hydrolase [Steroidobacteraceae bacterium]
MRSWLLALGIFLFTVQAGAQASGGSAQRRGVERELFRKVIEIPTVAGRGEMPRLVALLSAEFRKAGIRDITVKSHGESQSMIVRWPASRPSGRKPILLLAHMDVVEANRSDWVHDPFRFREADGYYWARGANDNKAGVVAIVSSLARLRASGFEPGRDIVVLFTGDEETQQQGARGAATEWRSLIDAEFALNSDSGGGTLYKDGRVEGFYIQVAEKTYADFRLTATNRGGHSSAPRTDNAIYQLAAALKSLEEYRFTPMLNEASRAYFESIAAKDGGAYGDIVKAWLADPTNLEKADLVELNEPGYTRTRCVATQVTAGHAPNALPQRAEANVNCRIFPGVTADDVRKELQAIAGREVTVELVDGGDSADASPLRDDVLAAYRNAVRTRFPDAPIVPSMSAGATDAVFLRAAGIPTYGVGGLWGYAGEALGAHGLNERIGIDAFHDQIDIWETMLRELAR